MSAQDGGAAVGRKLSRAISLAAGQLGSTVNDAAQFLDISQNIQSRVEEDAAGAASRPGSAASDAPAAPAGAVERKATEQMGRRLLDPKQLVLRDKLAFFLGVVNIGIVGFWVGRTPQTYHHYWLFKCVVLFSLRWWTYRAKGWQYLMLELCYAANALGLYFFYAAPRSALVRRLAFALMAGPLQFSIVLMRNSLVFHDFDSGAKSFR